MPIQCDDVRARMMELLYGELGGGELAAIETHVGGCARCQGELASFQRTRATLRTALEQSPPAHARESIMRAAAAQAAHLVQPGRATENTAQLPVASHRPSIWDWLRRRWAFPTLATVGALAVFLLASEMFLKPEKMLRTTPAPPTDDSVVAASSRLEAPAPGRLEGLGAPPEPSAAPAAASLPSTPVAPAVRERDRIYRAHAAGETRAGGKAKNSGKDDRLRISTLGGVEKKRAVSDEAELSEPKAGFAAPPPPRPTAAAGGAANLAGAGQPAELQRLKEAEPAGRDQSAHRGKTVPTVAPPPAPAAKPAPARAPVADSVDESPATARAESSAEAGARPKAKRRAARASADEGGETAVERADRLFASARWTEAAAAYRKLLQQNPDSADAARWRQRLTAAETHARDNPLPEPPP